jgi:hypothetical protein
MRSRRLVAGVVAACVALCAAGTDAGVGAAARPAPRALVGVGLREWNVAIYRRTVTTGRIRLSARNYGEDPHDIAVRGPHGYRSRASSLLRPGAMGTLDLTLSHPGSYRLVCTLPGHEQQGMAATLRVVKPRAAKRRRARH